ncbi:HAD family acid phosphatase [Streptomyces fuscichromogenes]|uniref:Acid phosphatase n=1 Tax=Streptomyces fuscichromogenes TaxID=1324013 RepID=A0A917XC05_9ACTN|nr:HAD family acid phosphatase [Streptomyces fuscichromogenes]GGN04244.1 acid phosphatase [Streptomyces fuscichromogenes]
MNRLTVRRAAVALTAGLALSFAAALPAQAADSTVTEAQWLSDVAAVTGPAQTYIDGRAAANTSGAKLAIVLDIDNTSLETYFEGAGFSTPATPPVLALAQDAHAKGVSVFFVSARSNLFNLVTKSNLTSVGYTVDGLYARTVAQLLTESVADFKTSSRKAIEANGYDIVANIGNNTTDLSGGYADTTYKLPDYDGLLD